MTPQAIHELKEAAEAAEAVSLEDWYGECDLKLLSSKDRRYIALVDPATIKALIADYERMRGAGEIVSAWLERWGSHVGGCLGGNACTCGLTNAKHEIRQALGAQSND